MFTLFTESAYSVIPDGKTTAENGGNSPSNSGGINGNGGSGSSVDGIELIWCYWLGV